MFCPSPSEDPKVIAARSKKAAIYAWVIYLLVFIKIVILYEYVEHSSVIPQQWWDSIIKTCPVWKKANTFHYSTMVHTGYMVMMPSIYLWNYMKHR